MLYIRIAALLLLALLVMGNTACEPTFHTYEYYSSDYPIRHHHYQEPSYFDRHHWWTQEHPPWFWRDFQQCRSWQSHTYCKRKMYLKWRFDH
ncbi:hypothetical protein LCGC14_1513510 [marine sediment metagenome]|uniref:Uncharacterized protein n=1 Tax=marine sediment metagenome TaxID=412755 RepID=A0A0F9J0R7_9ZZZZ